MKYIGYFSSIKNENKYRVEIITDNDSSSTTNITMLTDSFEVSIENEDNNLFKPCKYSNATIRFINEDYHFDLYSPFATGNKVTLFDDTNNNIIWIGYVTPDLYNNNYSSKENEIELNAIDGLSTLQYIDYLPLSGKKSDKNIVNMLTMLKYILRQCKCYNNLYINNNISYDSSANTECLISKCFISEQNFFDEDDKADKFRTVLEEICTFFNFTAIAENNDIYLIDYDSIKNNVNNYFKYNINDDILSADTVTLTNNYNITGSDYMADDSTISLNDVYNKVTIKDSLYTYENIFPDIFDKNKLKNLGGGNYVEKIKFFDKSLSGITNYYDEYNNHILFTKYYSNSDYTMYRYNKDNKGTISTIDFAGYNGMYNQDGAFIIEQFPISAGTFVPKIDYQNYIVLANHLSANSKYNLTTWKALELKSNIQKPQLFGNTAYLIFKGSCQWIKHKDMFIRENYPDNDSEWINIGKFDKRTDNDLASENRLYLTCKLKIGNLWYNNDNWKYNSATTRYDGDYWTDKETTFKLYFANSNSEEYNQKYNKPNYYINQFFEIRNTVDYTMNLDEEGYCIKLPQSTMSKIEFSIYMPNPVNGNKYDTQNIEEFNGCFIKDFKTVVAYPTNVNSDLTKSDNDTDTEYSNIINSAFTTDYNADDWKICTFDEKKQNYSCVAYSGNNGVIMLDKLYNNSFITEPKHRAEEQAIYKLVKQYSNPSCRLMLNLDKNINLKCYSTIADKYLNDKLFVVDSQNINYYSDTNEINIIEKK